jgi:hypothetical protein
LSVNCEPRNLVRRVLTELGAPSVACQSRMANASQGLPAPMTWGRCREVL